MKFIDWLQKTLRLHGAQKQMVNLVITDKKSDWIEDLVDKYEINSRISSSVDNFFFLLESTILFFLHFRKKFRTIIVQKFDWPTKNWQIKKYDAKFGSFNIHSSDLN